MNRADYEKLARYLVGKSIAEVSYYEIEYGDGQFHFFDDPRFDSLDFGLEFKLNNSEYFSFIWGGEFGQYGVSLFQDRMSKECNDVSSKNVSTTSRWASILNKRIDGVHIFWLASEEPGKQSKAGSLLL